MWRHYLTNQIKMSIDYKKKLSLSVPKKRKKKKCVCMLVSKEYKKESYQGNIKDDNVIKHIKSFKLI